MDTKDKHGHLPLSHAARYGSEVVEKLLVTWDDVEVDTSRGTCQSGVHNDAQCGHMTMFVCHWVAHTQREGMGDCICTVVTLFEPDIKQSEHLNLMLGAYYACTSGEEGAVSLFTQASGHQYL